MKKYILLGLILAVCLVTSTAFAGFWQGGGGGGTTIEVGTTGQVLHTSGTSSLVWGSNETLSAWYLPSLYEMWLMQEQSAIIDGLAGNYWTSNEITSSQAAYRYIGYGGNWYVQLKSASSGVRAIRSFDTTYSTGKYAIGDTLGGGKVFYVDATGKKGLISSLSDQDASIWGTDVVTGAAGDGIYAGISNSIQIIDTYGTAVSAARTCRDYTPITGGGSGVSDATYITQTPNGTLTAEQALSGLSTGLLKNTTGTGILTIAAGGTDFVPPNTAITADTKTKITYDAKGLVTAGVAATQDDIGDGTTYKQYSQTEKTKLAGIATGANLYVHPDHTGEVTSASDGATVIVANVVTNDKLATMTTKTYKGRTAGTTGNVEDVPVATLKSDLVLVKADVGLGNVTDNAQYYPGGTDVAIADGGTGQSTAQAAINALTSVSGATNEHVLTKDTTTGNVIFKAATGGVTDHTLLTNIGVNSHANIDTFLASKAAASGLASLDTASKVVQNPVSAQSTPAAGKIPIADGAGKLDGWVTGALPGGADTQIQFNDGGVFGGNSGLTFNKINGSVNIAGVVTPVSATGGIVTTSGEYTIHTFLANGDFVVTSGGSVEALIVAGGGGGGTTNAGNGGGGGAGGFLSVPSVEVIPQTYNIVVGAGGLSSSATNGGNSSFASNIAIGGGAGGFYSSVAAQNGGSGGGAGQGGAFLQNGGNGVVGQGFAGGSTGAANIDGYGGGGGGGANAVGGNAYGGTNFINGGYGGSGKSSSISGSPVTYAGGGAGSSHNTAVGGVPQGGVGGGGNGHYGALPGVSGVANTGGGGGGGGENLAGGDGGSGIVIIRYLTSVGSINSRLTVNQTGTGRIVDLQSNSVTVFGINSTGISTYADNAAAIAAGLSVGTIYKTATGGICVVY